MEFMVQDNLAIKVGGVVCMCIWHTLYVDAHILFSSFSLGGLIPVEKVFPFFFFFALLS